MGFGWDNIQRGWDDLRDWYNETTDKGYGWFGIESTDGQVTVTNAPREPRYSSWGDATDPNAQAETPFQQQYYPTKVGYSMEFGAEFLGSVGNPPSGTKFIGHAPDSVFDSLRMTMTNADLVDDYEQKAGFSARLVQRDYDNKPNFISGGAHSVTDDGVVYREDLRLPAKSPFQVIQTTGGPIERLLPLFITLTTYGDIGAVTGIDSLQIQVTVNLLAEESDPGIPRQAMTDPQPAANQDFQGKGQDGFVQTPEDIGKGRRRS